VLAAFTNADLPSCIRVPITEMQEVRQRHGRLASRGRSKVSRNNRNAVIFGRQWLQELLPGGPRRFHHGQSGAEEVLHGCPANLGAGLTPRFKPLGSRASQRTEMKLEGIHHVSSITGDAQGERPTSMPACSGLRLVKKDRQPGQPDRLSPLLRPTTRAAPGLTSRSSNIQGARPGRAGEGHDSTASSCVSPPTKHSTSGRSALGPGQRSPPVVCFLGPRGPGVGAPRRPPRRTPPLTASHPEIPAEYAVQGFEEVRAYTNHPEASRELLEGALEFEAGGQQFVAGSRRQSRRALRL